MSEAGPNEDNIEVLRPVYEQFSKGNFRPVTDAYGADLEWGWSEEFPDIAGVERGAEGQSEQAADLAQHLGELAGRGRGVPHQRRLRRRAPRYIGRGKGSGVDVDTPGAHLWTVKDGRAVRMVVFSDRERALEAAGLGPD